MLFTANNIADFARQKHFALALESTALLFRNHGNSYIRIITVMVQLKLFLSGYKYVLKRQGSVYVENSAMQLTTYFSVLDVTTVKIKFKFKTSAY